MNHECGMMKSKNHHATAGLNCDVLGLRFHPFRLLSSVCCLLVSAFCLLPSAFAGTHVTGVYSVGASPAVMATVNGNSEYGLVFAQRNKTVTYNNILYGNNIVTAYCDVNGNLNDGSGNQWIDLIPDANAAPDDSYYVVTINIQGSIHSEIWIVPDQTSASVISVRQTTAPPSGTTNFFYQALQQSGTSLAQRPTLNFSGAGMSCLDNAGLQRTDCTITADGFANPMSSPGDLIVGGAAGAATRLALGGSNLCLTSNGVTAAWGSCSAGTGTVTSFSAGTLAPLFTTSVANAATMPALTFALTSQSANLFYAGPSSGVAADPTFRSLIGADLPNPSATTLGGIESVTCTGSNFINSISTSGVPGCSTPAGSGTVTTSGTPVVNQVSYFTSATAITGTTTDTNTTHALFATATAPAFRALAGSDLPSGWNPVTAPNGGSGIASPTAHLVLVGEGASPFAPVPAGNAGQVLISNGASADPTFQDPIVSGPDAVGVTPTRNPVQVGCLFLTTPATLTNNQVGALQCTAAQRLIVDGSQVTQPVSGTFWQATQPVSGTFWQATQPVSAASLPLPSGASTTAKQPALGTAGTASADVITVQGIASMTALKVDGSAATQPVSGTFWQATQPVSGTVTANQGGTWTVQPGNTANTTAWKVDGSAVTQPVSGTVTANAGTGSFTVAQATAANLNATVTGTVATTPPANASTNISQIGGTAVVADPCQAVAKTFASFSITASTQIITGTSGKHTYICSWNDQSASAESYAVVEGTGTTCGTSTAAVGGMSGGTTGATGWPVAANGGRTFGNGGYAVGEAANATGDNVCVMLSGSTEVNIGLSYVQQ